MSAIGLILTQLLLPPAFAAAFLAPAQEGDHLVIKGLDAQIQLIAVPGSNALKVSGIEETAGEGAYVVTKKNNIIEIKMNEYDGKHAWMNILAKPAGHMRKIEISGLALPTEVQLHGGGVTAQKWSKDLKVSMTQGHIVSNGGNGSIDTYVQKGDILILDHTGKINADVYAGNLTIKNAQGDIDASLFTGPLLIEKSHGFCTVQSQIGPAKIAQGTGTLQIENGKGTFAVESYAGRIDGQNQDGTISVKMVLDSEVDIKSKAGKVQVQAAPSSGASVNLLTVEGDIFVPAELKVNKISSEKSVRGRLRGEGQRGSIFVRSQDGTIVVK